MLPYNLPLSDIDDGVRNLVINLNRIPSLYTLTTCEGHVWRDVPLWPTKNGWVHIGNSKDHLTLVERIGEYCTKSEATKYPMFSLNTYRSDSIITIHAHFEPHPGDTGVDFKTKEELDAYWDRADTQLPLILQGWKDIDKKVQEYIWETLHVDPESLPYVGTPPFDARASGCRHH